MQIDAIYIVKNEALNIKKSIDSCKAICEKVIVVDTGSTDDTKQICKELGCTIYNYEWQDDFSKARNYALSLSKAEVVIFLDADEYFETPLQEKDKVFIEEQIFQEGYDGVGFLMKDIDKNTLKLHHTSYACRMFLNNKKIYYVNKIHEVLAKNSGDMKMGIATYINLIHTGYSSDVCQKKVTRNLALLEDIKDKTSMDYFYLCREYLSQGNFSKSNEYCDKFFNQKDYKNLISNSNLAYTIYFYKVLIMRNFLGETTQNIIDFLQKARREIGFAPQVYYELANEYFNIDYEKSLNYYNKAIQQHNVFFKDEENNTKMNAFDSYKTDLYYKCAKIYYYMDKRQEAINCILNSCSFDKTNAEYLSFLLILLNREKSEDNIKLLKELYIPQDKNDYLFLLKSLASTNLHPEFLTFSYEFNNKLGGESDLIFYALFLTGQQEQALRVLTQTKNENSYFLLSICLLFYASKEMMDKYIEFLPISYQNAIKAIFGLIPINDSVIGIVCFLLSRLILLTKPDVNPKLIEDIISYAKKEDMQNIIACCLNCDSKEEAYKISKEYYLYLMNNDKIDDLNLDTVLLTCVSQKDYEGFMYIYEYYFNKNIINNERNYLNCLRLLKSKSKKVLNFKNKYIGWFNNAEKQ